MAEIEDRLRPQDGLSDFFISFARMEPNPQERGAAIFTFRVTPPGEHDSPLDFSFSVSARSDPGYGLDHMMLGAYDGMIDVLRHLLYQTDRLRSDHETRLAQLTQPTTNKQETTA
jgi:hypothetical protein